MPKRTSGLSTPKRSMASCHVRRGNGVVMAPRKPLADHAEEMARSSTAKTSSSSTKDISRSSWVNSGWRSARRSSSRMQRAIWK